MRLGNAELQQKMQFSEGLALHQQGQLAAQPDHFDALHLTGAIALLHMDGQGPSHQPPLRHGVWSSPNSRGGFSVR